MRLQFSQNDEVSICVREQSDAPAESEIVFEGRVGIATNDALSVVLKNCNYSADRFFSPASLIVRKTTPFGLLEFDATGYLQREDEQLAFLVKLLGTDRRIQRRAHCRTEFRTAARCCDLEVSAVAGACWRDGELRDVSIGGTLLLLRENTLEIGAKLLIDFVLSDATFSLPAVVRRIDGPISGGAYAYAMEYLDIGALQRDRIAEAIIKLQLTLIVGQHRAN